VKGAQEQKPGKSGDVAKVLMIVIAFHMKKGRKDKACSLPLWIFGTGFLFVKNKALVFEK